MLQLRDVYWDSESRGKLCRVPEAMRVSKQRETQNGPSLAKMHDPSCLDLYEGCAQTRCRSPHCKHAGKTADPQTTDLPKAGSFSVLRMALSAVKPSMYRELPSGGGS